MRLIDADKLKPNAQWSDFYEEFRAYSITQVDDTPTVKAIPIEWIEKKAEEHKRYGESGRFCAYIALSLIKLWVEENETN